MMFLASCENKPQQRVCDMPKLYLEGNEEAYIDTTPKWELKEKKVVRWDSLCGSDTVKVKYFVKNGFSTNRIEYTTQGKLANLDSIAASQNCNVIGGTTFDPYYPPSGGDMDNGNYESGNGGSSAGFCGLPEWLMCLICFILFCLLVWALISLINYLRREPITREEVVNYNTQHHHYNQPQQAGAAGTQQQLAAVKPGQPLVQSTCMAGTPGSVVIPPPAQQMKSETITIHRVYKD